MDASGWYVIQTKSRKEAQVSSYLCSQGIESYYPCVAVTPVNPRAAKTRPYFPGYLFVYVNLTETGESALQWIPGTVGLVYRDSKPVVVTEKFIQTLKKRTSEIAVDCYPLHADRLKPGAEGFGSRTAVTDAEALLDDRLTGEERVGLLEAWFDQ